MLVAAAKLRRPRINSKEWEARLDLLTEAGEPHREMKEQTASHFWSTQERSDEEMEVKGNNNFHYSVICFMSTSICKTFHYFGFNSINDFLYHGYTNHPKACMDEVAYLPLAVKLLGLHLIALIGCAVGFRQGR